MAKYGAKASEKVEKTMHERKRGTLKSGSGKKVTSKKQAIAIGLSEARRAGGKVPKQKLASKKASSRKAPSKKAAGKKTSSKKSSSKKSFRLSVLSEPRQPPAPGFDATLVRVRDLRLARATGAGRPRHLSAPVGWCMPTLSPMWWPTTSTISEFFPATTIAAAAICCGCAGGTLPLDNEAPQAAEAGFRSAAVCCRLWPLPRTGRCSHWFRLESRIAVPVCSSR